MGYTLFAIVLLVGITWAAEWSTVLDRDPDDGCCKRTSGIPAWT